MNDNANPQHHGSGSAVSLDHGHVEGSGAGLPERFENPGLPPHQPRHADVDPAAANRAERQVLGLFTLSVLGTLLFVFAYFAFDTDQLVFIPFLGHLSILHVLLGLGLALSLLGIGLGAVHWAKTLMPDTETIEHRHPLGASEEDREALVEAAMEQSRTAVDAADRPHRRDIEIGTLAVPLPEDDVDRVRLSFCAHQQIPFILNSRLSVSLDILNSR